MTRSLSPRIKFAGKLALLLLLLGGLLAPLETDAAGRPPVMIQFLSVSDWHAQVDPISVSPNFFGGAAYLAAYWDLNRAEYPNTLTLTAGDSFGASPPVSNYFNEEPAILAMRMMKVDVDTFGNHNFDRGVNHLQQMIDLAKAPKSEAPGKPFDFVSANLKNRSVNLDGVRDYRIYDVGGIKVAVIGITNPEAPTLVFPGSFGTMEPQKPHVIANKMRAQAEADGAQVVVAIIHSGVTGFDLSAHPYGPLIDFANKVEGFDVIFGDHTDIEYTGIINNQLVVESRSKGLKYARTILGVKPKSGRVVSHSVTFVSPITTAVTPDAEILAMLQPYKDALLPIFGTQIGTSSLAIPRSDACLNGSGRICESKIGNQITDAMRELYDTDFAITNAGGIRADLTCPTTDNPADFCPAFTPPPFPITRGQVNTVLPFGNVIVTMDVNGAELKAMLEQGVSAMPGVNGRFAQVSGLCFTYAISSPAYSRVTGAVHQAPDGTCTGAAVDLTAGTTYEIATNDFVANGGDGYPKYIDRAVTREVMDEAVADYITANSPLTPAIQGRIVCTTTGAPLCPVVVP